MSAPTKAQISALKWLSNRGGDGVFAEKSNHSVLIAQGDRAPITRGTWSKLERLGFVEKYGRLRLRITTAGRAIDLSRIEESQAL